jgi:hypothetical protein
VQHQAHVIEFTVYSGTFAAGNALATVTNAYQGIPPVGNPPLKDPMGLWKDGKTGSKGVALWSEVDQAYHVIYSDARTVPLIKFSLYQELKTSDANQANCPIVELWGAQNVAIGDQITVENLLTGVAGVYNFFGPTGAVGIAARDSANGKWRIIHLETQAKEIHFQLTGTLVGNGGAGPGAAANVISWSDGKQPAAAVTVFDPDELFPAATDGCTGIARWDSIARHYVVTECESQTGFVGLKLDAATAGNSAVSADAYDLPTWGTQQDNFPPAEGISTIPVSVKDSADLFPRSPAGAVGIGAFDAVNNVYQLLNCQGKAGAVEFTLTSAMSSGYAAATVTAYFGTELDILNPDSGGTGITVYDLTGHYGRALDGAKGVAIFDNVNNKYWIVECDQETLAYKGTLGGTLTNSTSSVSVGSLQAMTPTPFGQSTTGSRTATNPFGLAGASGAACRIDYNAAAGDWEITQVAHTVVTDVVDVQFDGTSKIQVKTQDQVVMTNGAVSSWTDKITLTQITYTTAVNWASPNLTYHTHTVYAFQDADDTDHNVDTATDCES